MWRIRLILHSLAVIAALNTFIFLLKQRRRFDAQHRAVLIHHLLQRVGMLGELGIVSVVFHTLERPWCEVKGFSQLMTQLLL